MKEDVTELAMKNATSTRDFNESEAHGVIRRLVRSPFHPIEHTEDILARAYAFIFSWSETKDEANSENESL